MIPALTLELPAFTKAVPDVRRAVREHLGPSCPEAQLCVTELLANVIAHVGEGTPVTVRLAPGRDDCVRVEVTDPDPRAWLVARRPGDEDETGRGLLLLGALSRRWGVWLTAAGKTVWCEVPTDPSAVRAAAPSNFAGTPDPADPPH
ncbi:ATP-binding protein [Streptomyces sp. NPDC056405]|uniref:ATP-binding protein n=1 Tax=Streptomyces sp. NPDC056405 TaxID=3345811 RepID=UPI0035D5CC6D